MSAERRQARAAWRDALAHAGKAGGVKLARRYSGDVTVAIVYRDRTDDYACRVVTSTERPRYVFVGGPATRPIAVDCREAFNDVARAAIAFAEVEGAEYEADGSRLAVSGSRAPSQASRGLTAEEIAEQGAASERFAPYRAALMAHGWRAADLSVVHTGGNCYALALALDRDEQGAVSLHVLLGDPWAADTAGATIEDPRDGSGQVEIESVGVAMGDPREVDYRVALVARWLTLELEDRCHPPPSYCNDGDTEQPWTLAGFREANADDPAREAMFAQVSALGVGEQCAFGIGGGITVVTRLS